MRPEPSSERSGASVSLVSRPDQARSQTASASCGSVAVRVRGGAHLVGDLPEEQPVARRPGRSSTAWCSGAELQRVRGRAAAAARCRRDRATTQPSLPGSAPAPAHTHLAGGGELVQHRRGVVGDPGRQHQLLQRRGGHRRALQLLDGAHQSVDAAQARAPPRCCHCGRKAASAAGGTGSSSWRSAASERRRSRRSTAASHHSWPLPAGVELALDDAAARGEALQRAVGDRGAQPEARGGLGGGERARGYGRSGRGGRPAGP